MSALVLVCWYGFVSLVCWYGLSLSVSIHLALSRAFGSAQLWSNPFRCLPRAFRTLYESPRAKRSSDQFPTAWSAASDRVGLAKRALLGLRLHIGLRASGTAVSPNTVALMIFGSCSMSHTRRQNRFPFHFLVSYAKEHFFSQRYIHGVVSY